MVYGVESGSPGASPASNIGIFTQIFKEGLKFLILVAKVGYQQPKSSGIWAS